MSELYYIALIPDQNLSQPCLEYKLMAKELFQTQATLRSIAHITLVAPFKADTIAIEQIKHSLNAVAKQSAELNLTLNGWNYFEERTVYLGCESHPQLTQLYHECQNKVGKIVQIHQEAEFIPHISIINRDLPKRNFIAAWSYFSTQFHPTQTTCSQLVIFKYSPEKWQIDQHLNLVSQVTCNA